MEDRVSYNPHYQKLCDIIFDLRDKGFDIKGQKKINPQFIWYKFQYRDVVFEARMESLGVKIWIDNKVYGEDGDIKNHIYTLLQLTDADIVLLDL